MIMGNEKAFKEKGFFKSVLDGASRAAGAIGMATVAFMALLVFLDVLTRLIGLPILGLNELTVYSLCISGFSGMAYAFMSGRHIRVELFLIRMKPQVRNALEILANLLGFVFFALMAWKNIVMMLVTKTMGERSEMLGVPAFPIYLGIAIGSGLLSLQMLISLLDILKGMFRSLARKFITQ